MTRLWTDTSLREGVYGRASGTEPTRTQWVPPNPIVIDEVSWDVAKRQITVLWRWYGEPESKSRAVAAYHLEDFFARVGYTYLRELP